ncbi:MAG: hypothetical protein U1E39_01300 [Planctomycetota bacterium]
MDEHAFTHDVLPGLLDLDAGPPDPNLVAAYLDGALPEAERRALERRLRVDPEAMLLVRALRADRRRVKVRRVFLAVAAVVVAAVGLTTLFTRRDDPSAAAGERLVAAAGRLRAEAPDLFEGFTPLSADELRGGNDARRGGGRVTWPVGVLLDAPTEVRFEAPTGATRVRLAIDGPAGRSVVEGGNGRVEVPPLPPGSYVVRMRALDALGAQEVRAAFVVLASDAARRHLDAFARIDATGGDLAPLLRAHYAVRQALYREARAAAQAASSGAPDDARALLAHIERLAPGAP